MASKDAAFARRMACAEATARIVPPPPAEIADDALKRVNALREKSAATGDPKDDAEYAAASCDVEDALADHCRVQLERAISRRLQGERPSVTIEDHATKAVADVSGIVGGDPWASGDELLDDEHFRKHMDIRMLLDGRSIADAEKAVAVAAQIIDREDRTVDIREVSEPPLPTGQLADEFDFKPPIRAG